MAEVVEHERRKKETWNRLFLLFQPHRPEQSFYKVFPLYKMAIEINVFSLCLV